MRCGVLGCKMLFWVMVISGVNAVIAISIQIYLDYRRDMEHLTHTVQLVERTQLPSLVNAVWTFDADQIERLVDGIAQIPWIASAQVRYGPEELQYYAAGIVVPGASGGVEYTLVHQEGDVSSSIGHLWVQPNFDIVDQRAWQRLATVLATQLFKVLVFSVCMVWLVHWLITRHLQRIAQFVTGYPPGAAPAPLRLDRRGKASAPDELDLLAESINDAYQRLHAAHEAEANLRAQLETRVLERTHDVEHAHQRLLASLRGGRLATWEWNIVTNVNRMDDAWLGMLGYERGEVPETFEGFRNLLHPDDVPVMESAVSTHLAGASEFYEVDFRMRAKDGRWRWIHAGGLAVERDAVGKPLQMAGIHLDITERRQAEDAKRTFISTVSHELRTPVNAIIGLCSRVLHTTLTQKQLGYLYKIAQSSELLLHIINDLLDFSKLDAGKLELEYRPFLLQDALTRVLDVVGIATEARGLRLVVDVARNVPPCLVGDRLRIEQILINLAGNAAKFTDEGEVVLSVRVLRQNAAFAELLFSVRDTGIGIAQEDLRTLFHPFIQLDGSLTRRHGGTGLGLAISRQLVERMGGHIWAESTLGQGSNFQFSVQLDVAEPPQSTTPVAVGHTLQPPEALRGKRVLLVEDNAFNQQVAWEMLEDAGIVVDLAGNGREAVNKVAAAPYDAILMDIQMPEMDGLEATRQIRARSASMGLPIIAMTAHGMNEMRQQGRQAGVSDYLIKPISPGLLYSTLLQWVAPQARRVRRGESRATDADLLPAIPGIDLPLAMRMAAGRPERLVARLQQFVAEMGDAGTRLCQCAQAEQWAQLWEQAHALKGAAGTVGASRLQTLATALLQAQDSLQKVALSQEVTRELEAIRAGMPQWGAVAMAPANATGPQPDATLPHSSPGSPIAPSTTAAWATVADKVARHLYVPEDLLGSLEAGLQEAGQREQMQALRTALARFDYSGAAALVEALR
ncbi:response regulator [Candidatus Symbiobacter mobilis]|uniref:Virulence sensor protein BvgS n=1 Tax=Candidatus Symbiobacter mobilis CR TaxID=946483 RepID=U5N9A2_9BURK|nr:response regulator [Candidatus Symbiobacter mobilis]AGX87977.1 signal transduction histidine kinase [Candidatus Symbiobacter mobilis CR]